MIPKPMPTQPEVLDPWVSHDIPSLGDIALGRAAAEPVVRPEIAQGPGLATELRTWRAAGPGADVAAVPIALQLIGLVPGPPAVHVELGIEPAAEIRTSVGSGRGFSFFTL